MKREEMLTIMTIMRDAYPRFYINQAKGEALRAIDLWTEMFAEYSSVVVTQAVKMLIKELQFPPTIHDVQARIDILTKPQEISGAEVWSKVLKAIGNSYYNSISEFEKLPEDAKRIVREPSQLKSWGQMDIKDLDSVVASNFLRQYATIQKSDKQRENVPEHMKLGTGERVMLVD